MAAGYAEVDWKKHVELDPRYLRPTEVNHLQGNATKARELLGWKPTVSFEDLVRCMVEGDIELALQEQTLMRAGHHVALRGRAYA